MDKFDRVYQLHRVLSTHHSVVPMQTLVERLECNKSTVYRIIGMMKDRLGAPIEHDKQLDGYRYAKLQDGQSYELPGLWFSTTELQALVVIQHLLSNLGAGLLEQHLVPFSKRLTELTQHQRLSLSEVSQRIRMPAIASRPAGAAFQVVAAATLQRQQLSCQYHSRSKNERTQRRVSPQRLIHYRESWYVDVWDEDRQALRSFSIDKISAPQLQAQRATDVAETQLDVHYASAYGIFGGQADQIAVLRFSAERARWVANEQWHPQQQTAWLADGRYELRIPYSDARELVMDIFRHGAHVEVIGPESLRTEISDGFRQALSIYSDEGI